MGKLFSFIDRDCNYIFRIFGIKISFKHRSHFKLKPVTEYGLTTEKSTPQIIVSLTSYPARIKTVNQCISTILSQSVKPDRVILWLADSQFINKEEDLPEKLLELKKYGLEIRWCEDIKALKKLLPSLREFPQDIIITADDDLYYPHNWLESLYRVYLKNQNCVCCDRISKLKFMDNKILKCGKKDYVPLCSSVPSFLNSIFGGSGCLFPPNSVSKEVFNVEMAYKMAYIADDLWLWAMIVLNKTKIVEVNGDKSDFQMIDGTVENSLCRKNKNRDFIKVYKELGEQYPQIIEYIKEELKIGVKND